jgi:hypothetical protein
MLPTAGMTVPKWSRDPLGTEGELTAGPDDWNPYDDEIDRQEIESMGFDADRVLDKTPRKRATDPLAELL